MTLIFCEIVCVHLRPSKAQVLIIRTAFCLPHFTEIFLVLALPFTSSNQHSFGIAMLAE